MNVFNYTVECEEYIGENIKLFLPLALVLECALSKREIFFSLSSLSLEDSSLDKDEKLDSSGLPASPSIKTVIYVFS